MNEQDIKQRIKQQSLYNAGKQGICYTEDPTWISTISWWIGGIVGFISFFVLLGSEGVNVIESVMGTLLYGLSFKGLAYVILCGIYYGGKCAKQGAVAATKEGSRLLDNATTAVAKKITIAVEKGKTEAKVEHEKQMLHKQMTDLELQYLRKRVEELEKKVNDK